MTAARCDVVSVVPDVRQGVAVQLLIPLTKIVEGSRILGPIALRLSLAATVIAYGRMVNVLSEVALTELRVLGGEEDECVPGFVHHC
ncbi:hypothetical protein BST36_17680 [Mycolicibacterium moriokaense]|nr:hypothetical protein [Mycolicibacterium moriokaense]MCV7037140.1 hypothetical protein [Mycolicibacterium moriokaense]ORB20893.1 hypothetical protein BST36_17680 [Mycolicibacterium moriokaense]